MEEEEEVVVVVVVVVIVEMRALHKIKRSPLLQRSRSDVIQPRHSRRRCQR